MPRRSNMYERRIMCRLTLGFTGAKTNRGPSNSQKSPVWFSHGTWYYYWVFFSSAFTRFFMMSRYSFCGGKQEFVTFNQSWAIDNQCVDWHRRVVQIKTELFSLTLLKSCFPGEKREIKYELGKISTPQRLLICVWYKECSKFCWAPHGRTT